MKNEDTFIVGTPTGMTMTIQDAEAERFVTIHSDGRVTVNPKYSYDSAARVFWEEVQRLATAPCPECEKRRKDLDFQYKLRCGTTYDPTT
jgi:hypothetical protein